MSALAHIPRGDLSTPQDTLERLASIEQDLAERQNTYESAARNWYIAKRDRERERALAFLEAKGTVDARKAEAIRKTEIDGKLEEAEYEAIRAVIDVLQTRASILQSLLKAQGRS